MMYIAEQDQISKFHAFLQQNPNVSKNLYNFSQELVQRANTYILDRKEKEAVKRLAKIIQEFLEGANKHPDNEELEIARFAAALCTFANYEMPEEMRVQIFTVDLDKALFLLGWPKNGPFLSQFKGAEKDMASITILEHYFAQSGSDDATPEPEYS